MSIFNTIIQLLAYDDPQGQNDNPSQRAFDWTRKMHGLGISKPASEMRVLAPGESLKLFNELRPVDLDGTSILSLSLLKATSSLYRLSVTAGPSGFRTSRPITGVTEAIMTVNNNAMATLQLTGATLSGVQVGDIVRINGAMLHDDPPFAFNPLNSGTWVIIGISGVALSLVRSVGESFSAANETVADASADIQIFSADGVQVGDILDITGTFSVVSQKSYRVQAVTPTFVDFLSTEPLPDESGLIYVPDSVAFYRNLKRFIYLEVDQASVVRLNGDTSDCNKLTPIQSGDALTPAWFYKWGDTFACTVVNKSINSLNLRYFVGE